MALYLVESFKEANLFRKLALIFLLIALFIGWVAYCTGSWGRSFPTADNDFYIGYGVWRVAANNGDNSNPTSSSGSNAPIPSSYSYTDGWLLKWYGVFQAFATFGFASLNIGFFLVVLLVFVGPCKCSADLTFWNAVNNIFGCVCWVVAVAVFAASFDDTYDGNFSEHTLHYSFGFAILTLLLQLVAAIVLLLSSRGRVSQTAK